MELKTETFDTEKFEVTYEVFPAFDPQTLLQSSTGEQRAKIHEEMQSVDQKLDRIEARVAELNSDIDRLTNHADGLDYMVAVSSGILTGLIDSFFVGEFSLQRGQQWGEEKINDFVIKVAKAKGYKGDSLSGAVDKLEEKFPIAADKATDQFGGGLHHHLRDFSHHPTPVGLFCSILTQFTGTVYGTNKAGDFHKVKLNKEQIKPNEKGIELIGKNVPEKLMFGTVNWFFHLVSDMAGSSGSISKGSIGTGLPGPILSLLKEISAIPIFQNRNSQGNKEFSVWISKLFNGTLLGERNETGKITAPLQFDLRTEIGVAHEIGRQALPVILNECIVRAFYFIRRFVQELKDKQIRHFSELKNIEAKNVLPFKNRTIVRMLTIATGTFTAVDLADAAIRSAANPTSIDPATFATNMLLRVNFVGVGRFVLAVGTDAGMGIKRNKLRNERIMLLNQQLTLLNAKVFFSQTDFNYAMVDTFKQQEKMWYAAESTVATLEEAYKTTEQAIILYCNEMDLIASSMQNISKYREGIAKYNPDVLENAKNILKWGEK